MKSFLDGYTSALSSDPKTNAETYLNSQLSDRERKGFSAASAMAASGMRAADIMDNLQALSPEERRKVMGALASRDAIASTQMKVAPGTPLPEIEKIKTEDRRAQEAELLRTETRLQKRLREIDESLAAGRESGFGGIVSPDTAARPRREVLMSALSPEEVKAAERVADEAEVARVGARLDQERLERDRLMDTGLGSYDPALGLPAPVPPRLDSDRGDMTAGDEDRAMRARYEAELAADRQERALRAYQEAQNLGKPVRDVVRGALLQGLTPAPSVGPSPAALRPEPFILDSTRRVSMDEPAPAPAPVTKPLSEMTDAELEALIQSGGL
jgi:hypothetical protein